MRKLDKRIKKVTDIKTPFSEDFEELSNYIGFNAYGADDANCFHDLDVCFFGALKRVSNESYDSLNFSFTIDNGKPEGAMPFRYMILEKDLEPKEKKEKSYRPYTLNEFLDKYMVCANIRIRQKDKRCQYFGKLIGYQFPTDPNTGKQKGDNDAIVCIGGYNFKLIELFNDYEQYDNMKDIWVPCGVEVEE